MNKMSRVIRNSWAIFALLNLLRFCCVTGSSSSALNFTNSTDLVDESGKRVAEIHYRLESLDASLLPQDAISEIDGTNAISFMMVYQGDAWLGLGLNPNGEMVGGDAIIGRPDMASSSKNPAFYGPMTAESSNGVIKSTTTQPMINGNFTSSSGQTVLTFTRVLNEGNALAFDINGTNTLIWAIGGAGVPFPSYHSGGRGHVKIDLSTVARPGSVTNASQVAQKKRSADTDADETDVEESSADETDVDETDTDETDTDETVVDEADTDETDTDESGTETTVESNGNSSSRAAGGRIKLDSDLNLQYRLVNYVGNDNGSLDAIELSLVYQGLAWLALGVNPEGEKMPGSQVVLGKPEEASSVRNPAKYAISGYGVETVTALPDTQQTLKSAKIKQQNGVTTLSYTKLLSEQSEISIDSTGVNAFVYAVGTSSAYPSMHKTGQQSFTLGLSGSAFGDSTSPKGASATVIYVAHGIMAVIAWALLAPMAAAASYLRDLFPAGPLWFKIHMTCNSMAIILTLACFILVLSYSGIEFDDPHFITGWVIIVAVLLQATLGIVRPPVDEATKVSMKSFCDQIKLGSIRAYWEVAHKGLGYLLLSLGLWQVYTGIELLNESYGIKLYQNAYWAWLITFSSVVTVLVLYLKMMRRRDPQLSESEDPEKGVEMAKAHIHAN